MQRGIESDSGRKLQVSSKRAEMKNDPKNSDIADGKLEQIFASLGIYLRDLFINSWSHFI